MCDIEPPAAVFDTRLVELDRAVYALVQQVAADLRQVLLGPAEINGVMVLERFLASYQLSFAAVGAIPNRPELVVDGLVKDLDAIGLPSGVG